jgi:hypothetical protein
MKDLPEKFCAFKRVDQCLPTLAADWLKISAARQRNQIPP